VTNLRKRKVILSVIAEHRAMECVIIYSCPVSTILQNYVVFPIGRCIVLSIYISTVQ